MGRSIMNCPECDKNFEPTHGSQKYCSKKCRTRKSHLTYYSRNKQEIIKKAKEYKLEVLEGINADFWRTYVIPVVKKRDGDKCVNCSSKRNLEVHHKEVNVDCPTIKDLVTLCKSCHRKEHAKLRRKKMEE